MKAMKATHRVSLGNVPLGGTTEAEGLKIVWRGAESPDGADPIDLINAAADRLQHLQTTAYGGDTVAKQIWEVEQCLGRLKEIEASEAASRSGLGAGFGHNVGGN